MDTRHIHGANLGISAAAYRAAGGFAALKLGEDVALVSSLLARKADVRFAAEAFESPVCHMAVVQDPDGNKLMIHKLKS